MVGSLGVRFGMSDRDVAELMEVGLHTEISLGSVPSQEQRVSAALAGSVEETKANARQQPSVNVDKTGWHTLRKQA